MSHNYYRKIKDKIFLRDGYKCSICGGTESLVASENSNGALITKCRSCAATRARRTDRNWKILEEIKSATGQELAKKYHLSHQRIFQIVRIYKKRQSSQTATCKGRY